MQLNSGSGVFLTHSCVPPKVQDEKLENINQWQMMHGTGRGVGSGGVVVVKERLGILSDEAAPFSPANVHRAKMWAQYG